VERAHKRIARRSPREASRPGSDQRQAEGARNTHRFGRFTSPPRKTGGGFERGSPKRSHARPGLRTTAPQGARAQPNATHLAMVTWVLHDWRGNTFRFVVCRSSIQGAMALQPRVSNYRWQRKQG